MIRIVGRRVLLSICAVALGLSACQSTQNIVDTVRIKQAGLENNGQPNANLYCTGTKQCEFERINDIVIVDSNTRRVSSQAIHQGIVRLDGALLNQDNNRLYLSVPANQYEVVIRFYPVTIDRAETFHVIHQFDANHRYTFKMYRDRSKHSDSLLNVSAPEPLCVELQRDQKPIRRFCRPYNALTGLGEFIEQKI